MDEQRKERFKNSIKTAQSVSWRQRYPVDPYIHADVVKDYNVEDWKDLPESRQKMLENSVLDYKELVQMKSESSFEFQLRQSALVILHYIHNNVTIPPERFASE